ncbi:MAG: hypothetical protein A3I81_01115 [Deltaproteobacteria bacterium RIFCSPLOWO2_02_FULL_55_12]|nr:MAG: hypothetical protein A3I81_01115 [Deltaproteobacteria bacterium RIFCSPLOWO2_02_FULL_55_12]
MEVIVPDDQLSLAIGKKGQNVRLAAKLTGWKIDIRTESDSKSGKEKLSPEEALRKEVQAAGEREERERAAAAKEMEETLGISSEIAATLAAAGYEGSDGVMKATREKLQKIEGLDEEGIDSIMDAVAALAGKGNA